MAVWKAENSRKNPKPKTNTFIQFFVSIDNAIFFLKRTFDGPSRIGHMIIRSAYVREDPPPKGAWKMSSMIEESLEAARKSGLTEDDIDKCLTQFSKELHVRTSPKKRRITSSLQKVPTFLWLLMYRIFPIGLILVFLFQRFYILYLSDPCLLAQPVLSEFTVPLLDCTKCRSITRAMEIYNISVIQFMNEHAFSLQPVLMKGAASDWSAVHTFSYHFFKDLYMQKPEAIDHDKSDGQFFPYSSSIHKLDEFMSLNNETAAMKGEKWYIGW